MEEEAAASASARGRGKRKATEVEAAAAAPASGRERDKGKAIAVEEEAASAKERDGGKATAEAEAASARERQEWKTLREAANPPYLSIDDALKVVPGTRVSLFAVVAEIGAAIHSRGTDLFVTLRIMDESCKTPISVTFFAKHAAQLPRVKSTGDMISLQNVEIQTKRRDGLDVFFVTFFKFSSSFALFETKTSAPCAAYQISKKYCDRSQDKELLVHMRTWVLKNPPGLTDLKSLLRDLKSDGSFDLVCKVLYVYEDSGKCILYVWDGTDTPAAEFQAILDAEALDHPLVLGPPLPREVLCKMPCVGTVLRIFSDIPVKDVEHMKNSIHWAKLWNITCKQEFGIWKGIFSKSSGVRLLSHEDGSVVDRLKMHESRKKVLRRPMGSIPSKVADVRKKGAYSTLMESLTHTEVKHQLKTLVRVVAAYPSQGSDFYEFETRDYCIQLTLEDPTARIHAYVKKKNMAEFLGGDSRTPEGMEKKLNKLLGVPEPENSEEVAPLTRNPPWIWCGLTSYCLDENNEWGTQRYQVCHTVIKD